MLSVDDGLRINEGSEAMILMLSISDNYQWRMKIQTNTDKYR